MVGIFKCVLVTGGCGFIGSNFINRVVLEYPDTLWVNLDAMYYCADINNIHENVRNAGNYIFVEGNTNSYDLVSYVLKTYNVDGVINFAAQSHVCNSFGEPMLYTRDNVMGTHTLLEACRNNILSTLKKFIHVSTDEVYGESELNEESKSETSILYPTNPYSATKAAAEMLVISYYKSFKLPIIITRGNNVYGPNQYPEKLIPKFIQSLLNHEKCTIHGKGDQLRSFLYIDDVVDAFELIVNGGTIGEIYNIGTHDEYTVMEVTKLLIEMIHEKDGVDDYIEFVKDRDFNDKRYHISIDKLQKLGWKQKINIQDGLRKTITFYKKKY